MTRINAIHPWALVLLCSSVHAQTWIQLSVDGFGDANNLAVSAESLGGVLYAATKNSATGAEVWRHSPVTGWSQINLDGFQDANNASIGANILFGGSLYVATENGITGTEVWRFDGAPPWTQVNANGFGDANNVDVREFLIHNASLYATTQNSMSGCEVRRYDGASTWALISLGGLGDPNTYECDVNSFNGDLYAVTLDFAAGCRVWKYASGTTWNRVDPDAPGPGGGGFDGSGPCNHEGGVLEYAGHLYVCTTNTCTGAEVWRYDGGTTWTQVNADGFGDSDNAEIDEAVVFDGRLFIGALDEGTASISGAEVWSYDGAVWTQSNVDGFGNPANETIGSFAIHEDLLCASTANSGTGTEIWRFMAGTTWARLTPTGFGGPLASGSGPFVHEGELHADAGLGIHRMVVDWTRYCTGDGSGPMCPCSNAGAAYRGCNNAQSTGGVRLDATGSAALNTIALRGSGFPPSGMPAVLAIRSLAQSATSFGDGVLCVASPIFRLGMTTASSGSSSHALTHVAGSGTFHYQLWYRNTPAAFCDPGAAFNLSNGLSIAWP